VLGVGRSGPWQRLMTLALILIASPGCWATSRQTVRLVRLPRPTRPELPKLRWTILAKADGTVFGIGQLKFRRDADGEAFDDIDGEWVYIVDPTAYDEAWIRILGYVRELEAAPVWEAPITVGAPHPAPPQNPK